MKKTPVNITRPSGTKRYFFSIRINGKKINKGFPDSEYGTKEKALEAAVEYKKKIYKDNNLSEKGRGGLSGNATGVSRTSSFRDNLELIYWQATWVGANKKQVTRRFPVSKYGERKAKQMAVAARKDALKALAVGDDPRFIQPLTKYKKLWRYMDFTKFLSMLEDSAIFFSRADMFEDPYEGEVPKGNEKLKNFVRSKHSHKNIPTLKVADKTKIMISCWHMSSYESAAMWKLYGQANEAICITTKYAKLKNQLSKYAKIGLVQYVNYNTAWAPENNIYYPYMFKRKSFEHEKEVRAIIDSDTLQQDDLLLKAEYGYKYPVNINTLIDEIYVDPSASEWFLELVKNVVSRYHYNINVIKSPLLITPESANKSIKLT